MTNLPAYPPLPEDLRGADDVVSVREAYTRGWQDALHAAAEAIRAVERGADIRTAVSRAYDTGFAEGSEHGKR